MALRKYRTKPVEAEPAMSAVDGLQPAPEPSPVAVESPTAAAPVDDDLANMKEQLHSVRFASKPLEQRIDEMGDLSVPQRAWLRSRPHALNFGPLLEEAHKVALQNGIQPDTPEYFGMLDFVLHHAAFGGNQMPMQQAPEPQPAVTTKVTREPAKMEDEPADTFEASIYSAPPSRGDYATTGGSHIESPGRITLNAAQREAARASGVSEIEYAKNLLKLGKMKQAGLIRD